MTNEPEADARELFAALHGGDDDAVVRLLRAGVPAEATDPGGHSALYVAAVSDRPVAVRLLLAAGADPARPSGAPALLAGGGELPLCGAACGGHTEVARALLAAGAPVDQREAMGFTALAWAVQQGHTTAVELLLGAGADPGLPGPHGRPALVAAAARGSAPVVRALLRGGAGAREAALAEARALLGTDAEAELRRDLPRSRGPGDRVVCHRVEEDEGVTVVVELLREGRPVAGAERGTSHAAVATLLEAELGRRTAYAELADRALGAGRPEHADWAQSVAVLRARGDEETFQAAAAWCASGDEARQAFAADVLAGLGLGPGAWRPFAPRAVPLLCELARDARGSALVLAAVRALGHQGQGRALPGVLRHAGHPDPVVREAVAEALARLTGPADGAGTAALAVLARDARERVRRAATAGLAGLRPGPAPDAERQDAIRQALAERLDDPDAATAAEAARGLAVRQDPRAVEVLARLLREREPGDPVRGTALAALPHVRDAAARRRLEWTLPRRR
ncbi:ankyrin repeat domain-containing protein [Streptomyces sp. NPDC001941]|uniref:ankyrin repeat domain-containing protein n=1 Tax=Streptomyces sp. NPDC001941 TaxID=3154659 RepID=UPI0033220284